MDFTAVKTRPDDDGIVTVTITGPETVITHRVAADQADQWTEQELAILNHPLFGKDCEHGLNAALCQGPMHY